MLREPAPGTTLGSWRIVKKLGQGGMGAVYQVEDGRGRHAALKLLLDTDPDFLARFEREGLAAKSVRHENVAAIHETFAANRMPMIAMELLPGGSLLDLVRKNGVVPWREVCKLGAGIARGLAAIHAARLVHRDLKPANILLDSAGVPKITDFGLVRRLSGGSTSEALTKSGQLVGTLAYMAPEQLEAGEVDAKADLYGLGATLYHLLSGRPPFEGQGYELVKKHLTQKPRSLRDQGVSAALDALVLRLLEKSPDARPRAADDVARELDAILAGKAASRLAWPLVGAAVALGVTALVGTALLVARPSPSPPPPPPPPAPSPAPAPVPVRPVAPRPPPRSQVHADSEQRVRRRYESALGGSHVLRLEGLRGHEGMCTGADVNALAFATLDGSTFLLSGGDDGILWAWDLDGLAPLWEENLKTPIWSISVAAGSRVAVVGGRGVAITLELGATTRRELGRLGHAQKGIAAVSDDGTHAACVDWKRTVRLWRVGSADLPREKVVSEGEGHAWFLRFEPGSTDRMRIGTRSGNVHVVDFARGTVAAEKVFEPCAATAGAFLRDGAFVALGLHGILTRPGGYKGVRVNAGGAAVALDASPDGRWLATGARDGSVEIHDALTGRTKKRFLAGAGVECVAFHPDSTRLAAAGSGGDIFLVDRDGAEAAAPSAETHRGRINALSLAHDPPALVSAGEDGTARTWDPETLALERSVAGTKSPAVAAAFHRVGAERRLAVLEESGLLRLAALTAGERELATDADGEDVPMGPAGGSLGMVASPDETRLLVLNKHRPASIFAGIPPSPMEPRLPVLEAAAFMADGLRLAVSSPRDARQAWLAVFDLVGGRVVPIVAGGPRRSPGSIALAGEGDTRRIVAGAPDGTLQAFDSGQHEAAWSVKAKSPIVSVASLGRRIAVIEGGSLGIFDVADGTRVDSLDFAGKVRDRPTCLAASADGRHLWLGTLRGVILRFRVD